MKPYSNYHGLPLEKRYPQEKEMVRPIVLPSLHHRKTNLVPLEKKYPVEKEPLAPIKLASFHRKQVWPRRLIPVRDREEEKYPIEEALGMVQHFGRGPRNKNNPTVHKPQPDIVPAALRDSKIRSKDIPRTKNKISKVVNIDDDVPAKNSTKRLTLVERLKERIEARRKANEITQVENTFLSESDKIEKVEKVEVSEDSKKSSVDETPLSWNFLQSRQRCKSSQSSIRELKHEMSPKPKTVGQIKHCFQDIVKTFEKVAPLPKTAKTFLLSSEPSKKISPPKKTEKKKRKSEPKIIKKKPSSNSSLTKKPEWVNTRKVVPTTIDDIRSKYKPTNNKYKNVRPRYLEPKKATSPISSLTTPTKNPRLKTVQSRYMDRPSLRLTPSISSLLKRNTERLKNIFNKKPKKAETPPKISEENHEKRIFPKLYNDLYTGYRQIYTPDKSSIASRLKKFDDLLTSTQESFKQNFEFSDLSDFEDKKSYDTSFKNILKECDAINDLLTPILIPQKNDSTDTKTSFPNFLTWKTDYLNKQVFQAKIDFSKSSSSFTKGTLTGKISVESELMSSMPSLTSLPEKSREIISTDECLTPDCHCKSSTVMTYAVCQSSSEDLLSPISSLTLSGSSTPECFCSKSCSLQDSIRDLKKKIEEAIIKINLESSKIKNLPPLKTKKLDSMISSSVQTDKVEFKRPLGPVKLPVKSPDPILDKILNERIVPKLKPLEITKCSLSNSSFSSISGSLALPWTKPQTAKEMNRNLFTAKKQEERPSTDCPPAEPAPKPVSDKQNTIQTSSNFRNMTVMNVQIHRSQSFSPIKKNKRQTRKVASETSVRSLKPEKAKQKIKIEEKYPEEEEPIAPVPLYSRNAQEKSTKRQNSSSSLSLTTFSYAVNLIEEEKETKTEVTDKCTSRTAITSSLDITGPDLSKMPIKKIDQFLTQQLKAVDKESLIHVHRTSGAMNVQRFFSDPSAESFLNSSSSNSVDFMQFNLREGVGHRFFRKPPPLNTELIEIKPEQSLCESQEEIFLHRSPAMMDVLVKPRVPRVKPKTPEALQNTEEKTPEDSTEQDSTETSTETTETSESTKSQIAETIVQTTLVDIESELPEEKQDGVHVAISVQSLGSIPPLTPSDAIFNVPKKRRSVEEIRTRRNVDVQYPYFRGEFNPPIRKSQIDSFVQTDSYRKRPMTVNQ